MNADQLKSSEGTGPKVIRDEDSPKHPEEEVIEGELIEEEPAEAKPVQMDPLDSVEVTEAPVSPPVLYRKGERPAYPDSKVAEAPITPPVLYPQGNGLGNPDTHLDFVVTEEIFENAQAPEEREEAKPIPLTQTLGRSNVPLTDQEKKAYLEAESEKLRLIFWHLVGGVIKTRLLENDVLARVFISRKMKESVTELPEDPDNPDNEETQKPIICINPETLDLIQNMRDGYYLVLKVNEGGLFKLGGIQARPGITDEERNEIYRQFESMKTTDEFFGRSKDIEHGKIIWGQGVPQEEPQK